MSPELNVTPKLVRTLVKQMKTFREACGDDIGLKLDLNYNFKTDGFIAIAKALTPEALVRATRAARVARASPAITMRAAPPTMSHPPAGRSNWVPSLWLHARDLTRANIAIRTPPAAIASRHPPPSLPARSPAPPPAPRDPVWRLCPRLCGRTFLHACTWDSGK